jgi:hypothetical protein
MDILEQRLSFIADTKASLNARVSELNQLRDQVRNAELSARKIGTFHANNSRAGFGELNISS